MSKLVVGGVEVEFDLNRITNREYRELLTFKQTDEEGDAIVAKAAGLTPEQLADMPYMEYRRLLQGFFVAAREPLADPN